MRRLRREGLVPGVVYSGGAEARPFQAPERDIRGVLAEGAALFDLEIEGVGAVPVVVKEQQHHPVRGSLQHIDLQEVRLDEAIQAEVAIELEGAESAPGVKGGGVAHECILDLRPLKDSTGGAEGISAERGILHG